MLDLLFVYPGDSRRTGLACSDPMLDRGEDTAFRRDQAILAWINASLTSDTGYLGHQDGESACEHASLISS